MVTTTRPTSICRTRTHFNDGRKLYAFDVQTNRGPASIGVACGGYPTRAAAVAMGKAWRGLLERSDYPATQWNKDYTALMTTTKAGMDQGLIPTPAGQRLLDILTSHPILPTAKFRTLARNVVTPAEVTEYV